MAERKRTNSNQNRGRRTRRRTRGRSPSPEDSPVAAPTPSDFQGVPSRQELETYYSNKTVRELKGLCTERNIDLTGKKRKAEIVDSLIEYELQQQAPSAPATPQPDDMDMGLNDNVFDFSAFDEPAAVPAAPAPAAPSTPPASAPPIDGFEQFNGSAFFQQPNQSSDQLGPTLANAQVRQTVNQVTSQLRQTFLQEAQMDRIFFQNTRSRSNLGQIEQDVLSLCLGHNPTVTGAARQNLLNQFNTARSDQERAQAAIQLQTQTNIPENESSGWPAAGFQALHPATYGITEPRLQEDLCVESTHGNNELRIVVPVTNPLFWATREAFNLFWRGGPPGSRYTFDQDEVLGFLYLQELNNSDRRINVNLSTLIDTIRNRGVRSGIELALGMMTQTAGPREQLEAELGNPSLAYFITGFLILDEAVQVAFTRLTDVYNSDWREVVPNIEGNQGLVNYFRHTRGRNVMRALDEMYTALDNRDLWYHAIRSNYGVVDHLRGIHNISILGISRVLYRDSFRPITDAITCARFVDYSKGILQYPPREHNMLMEIERIQQEIQNVRLAVGGVHPINRALNELTRVAFQRGLPANVADRIQTSVHNASMERLVRPLPPRILATVLGENVTANLQAVAEGEVPISVKDATLAAEENYKEMIQLGKANPSSAAAVKTPNLPSDFTWLIGDIVFLMPITFSNTFLESHRFLRAIIESGRNVCCMITHTRRDQNNELLYRVRILDTTQRWQINGGIIQSVVFRHIPETEVTILDIAHPGYAQYNSVFDNYNIRNRVLYSLINGSGLTQQQEQVLAQRYPNGLDNYVGAAALLTLQGVPHYNPSHPAAELVNEYERYKTEGWCFGMGAPISGGLDPRNGMDPFDREAAIERRHQRIAEFTTVVPNTPEMKAATEYKWNLAEEQKRQREVTRTHMNLVARQNQALTGQFGSLAQRDNRFLRDLLIADYIVVVEAWNKIYFIWREWYIKLGRDRPEERQPFEKFFENKELESLSVQGRTARSILARLNGWMQNMLFGNQRSHQRTPVTILDIWRHGIQPDGTGTPRPPTFIEFLNDFQIMLNGSLRQAIDVFRSDARNINSRGSDARQQVFESPQSFAERSFNQHLQNIIPGTTLTLDNFQAGFRQMNQIPKSNDAVGKYRAAVSRITQPRRNASTLAANILHGENHDAPQVVISSSSAAAAPPPEMAGAPAPVEMAGAPVPVEMAAASSAAAAPAQESKKELPPEQQYTTKQGGRKKKRRKRTRRKRKSKKGKFRKTRRKRRSLKKRRRRRRKK